MNGVLGMTGFLPEAGGKVALVAALVAAPGAVRDCHLGIFRALELQTLLYDGPSPSDQKVIVKVLERMGLRVDVVANGLEAVEAVARTLAALGAGLA